MCYAILVGLYSSTGRSPMLLERTDCIEPYSVMLLCDLSAEMNMEYLLEKLSYTVFLFWY
jgi:hypothetical protein